MRPSISIQLLTIFMQQLLAVSSDLIALGIFNIHLLQNTRINILIFSQAGQTG